MKIIYKSIMFILLTCITTLQITAQLQPKMFIEDYPDMTDSTPVIKVFNNGFSIGRLSSSFMAESNNTGNETPNNIYTRAYIAGFDNHQWGDYGIWTHNFDAYTPSRSAVFSAGHDMLSPNKFVAMGSRLAAIQIVDGTESQGFVLTSDTVGRANWQDPALLGLWTADIHGAHYHTVGIGHDAADYAQLLVVRNGPQNTGNHAIAADRIGFGNNNLGKGISWAPSESASAIHAGNLNGNTYTAGIVSNGFLQHDHSASIVGTNGDASILGALAYRDGNSDVWAGYFKGNCNVTETFLARGIRSDDKFGPLSDLEDLDIAAIDRNNNVYPNIGGYIQSGAPIDPVGAALFFTDYEEINALDGDFAFTALNASAFNVSSDTKVKKDIGEITPAQMEKMISQYDNIHSIFFRYLNENEEKRPYLHIGVDAATMPNEVVHPIDLDPTGRSNEKISGVNLADWLGLNTAVIKFLVRENEKKQSRIDELESRLNALEELVRDKLEMR